MTGMAIGHDIRRWSQESLQDAVMLRELPKSERSWHFCIQTYVEARL